MKDEAVDKRFEAVKKLDHDLSEYKKE